MADDPGGLTAGTRMERIEDALGRIENKLDSKASLNDLQPLTRRIELLEAGETPLGRIMMKQWEQLTATVGEIGLHGSTGTKEAIRRLDIIETEVENLKSSDVSKRAEDKAAVRTSERYYKRLTAVLSVAVILLMCGQIILAVTH